MEIQRVSHDAKGNSYPLDSSVTEVWYTGSVGLQLTLKFLLALIYFFIFLYIAPTEAQYEVI